MGYNYIHGESSRSTSASRRPWKRPARRPTLGDNILGSGFSFQLHAHHGFGAYICGEETALLESLEGKKGQPRFKPPFPASFGLYGKPTTINNTETFAAVPWIIRHGGQAFLETGKPNNGGTKMLLRCPVTSSVPATTRSRWARLFATLLELAGGVRGPQAQGRDPRRFVHACAAGRRDDGLHDGLRLDRQGRLHAGSGAVIVMDETRCMVKSLLRLSYFYMHESCGQCTPCREGTGWLCAWWSASKRPGPSRRPRPAELGRR